MSTVPPGRSPEELRELLAAYALDAVDDVERRAVERFVAQDEAAAVELWSLRATAAELGAAGPAQSDLPTGLRASVLAGIARTPQERPSTGDPSLPTAWAGTPGPARRTRVTHRGLRLAAAAAALVAVALPSGIAWQQHDRAVQAEQRAEQAEQRAEVLDDVLADPGAQLLRGEVTGGGEAVAILTDERALLMVDGLPRLEADRTYQLWAMRDGVPVPAGMLGADGGTVQVLAEDYRPGDGLAVSVEPEGGSDQPTTTPVLVLLPG